MFLKATQILRPIGLNRCLADDYQASYLGRTRPESIFEQLANGFTHARGDCAVLIS